MMKKSHSPAMPTLGWPGALGLLLALAVVFGVVILMISPPMAPGGRPVQVDFDRSAAVRELAPDKVAVIIEGLSQDGSRILGEAGHGGAAHFLEEQLTEAGYEVIVRRNLVAAPVLERNELIVDGAPVPGITLHPFQPNYFQPIATPSGGLLGTLVKIDQAALDQRTSFDGAIGVIDLSDVPKDFGLEWLRYAQLGLSGMILAAPGGFDVDWSELGRRNTMVSTQPVNFLRAYASGDLLSLIGKQATIHLQQRYRLVENTTLVGRLASMSPAQEALVLTGSYDAFGILPTLANEPMQAVAPATTLALARAMAQTRDTLQRDVLVVFDGSQMMANLGEAELIRVIGHGVARSGNPFLAEITGHEDALQRLAAWDRVVVEGEIFSSPTVLRSWLDGLDGADRKAFEQDVRYVLQEQVFLQGEPLLEAKLPLDRAGKGMTSGPEYEAFHSRVSGMNLFKGASSVSLPRLVERGHAIVRDGTLQRLLGNRIKVLTEYHGRELERARTDSAIREMTQRYKALFVLNPRLLPKEDPRRRSGVAFLQGEPVSAGSGAVGRQEPLFSTLVRESLAELKADAVLQIAPVRQALFNQQQAQIGRIPNTLLYWNRFAHPAFMMVNDDRLESYLSLSIPPSQPGGPALDGMAESLALLGQVTLSIGHGAMPIRPPEHPVSRSYSGVVLASGVGQSVIPSFAMRGALVGVTAPEEAFRTFAGYNRYPLLITDPYGRYSLVDTPADFLIGQTEGYTPQAFWYGVQGQATWVKDATGSKIFKSEKLPAQRLDFTDLNLVVFRATPVSFLDITNPQTLQPFAAVGLISREGLSPFLNSNQFPATDAATLFTGPDRHFYTVLRAGLPDNPLVQSVRGFLLGPAGPESEIRAGGIAGDGYLAADHPLFADISLPMARSMLRLNETRAELQERRNLLDPGTEEFIKRSGTLLAEAEKPDLPQWLAILKARESAAYSAIVHPILRANINGAVISILWYLGLLVPFVFFMERLLFGFADIRKQLAAQAVIFLLVFGLLRLMHPAFDMIRSAVMILLGFVILLIAGGVTVIFAGKFRENMAALEALRGKAAGASVNTMGIVATAFLLGLNNMHRRKVRTGLTCGTLVLITFAMIAFTSVRHDVVETVTPLGPAPWQGLLVQNDDGRYISPSEVFALAMRFGRSFPVEQRSYLTGSLNKWTRQIRTPSLDIQTVGETGGRTVSFASVLQFGAREPMRSRIPLVSCPFWFPEVPTAGERPVIVSDRIAADLGIEPRQLDEAGAVPVLLNGARFLVAGIFDSEAFERLRDLNGRSLLPPDISAIPNVRTDQQGAPLADPADPRVPAADVVFIAAGDLGFTVSDGLLRIPTVAIGMEDLSFRDARQQIVQYLEQTGNTMIFGLDGVASVGRRVRSGSLQGLPDLVMPLIIAALTVLNTMKGSVYERRDEIYVYNAVGVAPRYVFFMFFAEAFVYSVVGAVLGYLLAQGTGFFLTTMGWTGGLNMTFAGVNTILASLAVIAAVFISTLFPARTAMQIAAPSEDSGWVLPEPRGDEFSFNLPFTFSPYDRIAVLAFFHRFLVDHGEGGSGRFRAGPPVLELEGEDADPQPQIRTTIWLKPYDLGVSQELLISLPHDPETGEYIARIGISLLSGTRESWVRLNRALMEQVRRQFLHWRAVTPAQKAEFHREAMALFTSAAEAGKETHV